jgi:hypothetical protein
MNNEINRNVMIGGIVAAILIAGGLGYLWISQSKPQVPANYQPVMPPSGYGGQASGMAARMGGGGAGRPGPGASSGMMGNGPGGMGRTMTGNGP